VAQSHEEIEWPYPDQQHFVFLYYGAIATRRGLFEFIEGFREVHTEIPDARLLIIGPVDKADKARFFTMIEDEELRDKILYIPWIAHKFSTQYIQKSDVCLAPFHVNPQHNSGVANKLYLYLQTGKFILASACKPQTALIQEFNAGHIFHDQEEMKREILWCATHKSEVLAMGQLAGAKFTESGYKEKNGNAYIATIKHWLH
jgi:glycosyltransferase involved in cell wall biosynthesis